MQRLIKGDCLTALKELEANSIDAVVTDPPYGYSFMGKDWDKAVPSVEIWQECLRVLKPGGWCMVMSAPRSDVQNAMISRLMEAGFRLDFTPIYWTYASGFPKAGNVGKLVDKRLGAERKVVGIKDNAAEIIRRSKALASDESNIGFKRPWMDDDKAVEARTHITEPGSPEAKALDGSYTGFQPKPAVEVIIVAMKPLSEKTYVDQALKNGKGITWLDDCRVPTQPESPGTTPPTKNAGLYELGMKHRAEYDATQGRFPANLLVSDDVLNDGRITKSTGGNGSKFHNKDQHAQFHSDRTVHDKPNGLGLGDSGSYSRYFDLDAWARERLPAEQAMTFPFAIFPKASKSEKNKGLDALPDMLGGSLEGGNDKRNGQDKPQLKPTKNGHPTVKPLKLMSYLITLTTREGDTVLDPFVGSGTTVVAAKQLDRIGIGIERELEYFKIAKERIENANNQDTTSQ